VSANKLQRKSRPTPSISTNHLLPALVAVGSACSLAATPAAALELGEIQVNSALGQPLRASIAYALAPNEQLASYCIYLRPSGGSSDIPVVSNAQISVTDGAIIVSGNTPVREPILGMQVAVDCPYTPHLLRAYTLMVDPIAPAYTTPSRAAVSQVSTPQIAHRTPVAATQSNSPNNARATRTNTTTAAPIGQGSEYQVQPGDTLSTIVSRIEGRTMKLWPSVNALFAANPGAFIDNDVNRLMAGKTLLIPSLVGNAPEATQSNEVSSTVTNNAVEVPADTANSAIDLNVAPQVSTSTISVEDNVAPAELAAPEESNVVIDPADGGLEVTSLASDPVINIEPGDIAVSPTEVGAAEIIIPNTIIEDETATRAAPVKTDSVGTGGSRNWLMWLGGSGIALFLGTLLFGRSLRERFGTTPAGSAVIAGRRENDDPSLETPIGKEIDYEFEDTINSRAISLDADLEAGTGLHQNLAATATEDYGVADVVVEEDTFDLEITAESAFQPTETPTDVIGPHHRADPSSILESEELPESDEEYDLSMIVDATKQSLSDTDDTATDLQAIEISATRPDDDDNYTLSQEIDYKVLEQDYEDELTATQALNAEVLKAAEELAASLEITDDGQVTEEMEHIEEPTNKLRAVENVRELPADEKTAEMELPTLKDPNNTAELTARLPTDFQAVNDENVDSTTTVEVSAAGSDITVEMQVESGRVDTKNRK